MKVFWVQRIDLDLFSDISRVFAMTTNFVEKWQTPLIRRSGIPKPNEILLPQLTVQNDASISCKNFVNFGAVTPELTQLIC